MEITLKNGLNANSLIFGYLFVILISSLCRRQTAFASVNTCPARCKCSSLLTANCVAARLSNDSDFWNDLYPRVEDVNLAENELQSVPPEISQFADIVTLNLAGNNISQIAVFAFDNLKKLVVLDLSRNNINQLSKIHSGVIFLKNKRLQILNLSRNPITHLGNNFKDSLCSSTLKSLDVSHCDISYLQGPTILLAMPNLKYLNLSSNRLTMLDGLSSSSVESLDVTNCSLSSIRPDTFSQLFSLKRLYVSDNSHLSGQFKLISSTLEVFEADHCLLDSMYIPDLPNIRKVSLKNNRLKDIPPRCFEHNELLEELNLSENSIVWVSEFAFNGATSLKRLDLSKNHLIDINEFTFAFNLNLMMLNLSHNRLDALPQLRAPSLITLDASHCEIRNIKEQCLMYMSPLQRLNLSYNLLEGLPKSFSSPSLNDLDLSFCRLLTVNSSAINDLLYLNKLDLTGNRLVYIRNSTFYSNPYLKRILLGNNPWLCDCTDNNFKNLWYFLANVTASKAQLNELICLSPLNMTGLRWSVACDKYWKGQAKNTKDLILLCAVLGILLLCGMLACAVGYKKKLSSDEIRRMNRIDSETAAAEERSAAESDRISQTIQKLSKLPSYDEALLLPQISVEQVLNKTRKRQSSTQTEETMETLMKQINVARENKSSDIVRHSMHEVEYMNLPTPIQCTEL